MDSQTLTVFTGAAGLVVGVLVCWLVMRGRVATAAAQGRAMGDSELADARDYIQTLDEERQRASATSEALSAEAAQSREALAQAQAAQGQLAERTAQVATLEAQLLTLQAQEQASQQALQRATTSDTDNAQSLKLVSDRLVEVEAQNETLKHNLADISATLEDLNRRTATQPDMQESQLPILEIEVLELQSLAKTIQQEFVVLQDVQRNFTAASSALQDVS